MSSSELVSVLIPTFNSEAYLAEAITSVLDQDWQDLEIVVVDDGSTDSSFHIAQSFDRVTVLQGPHEGLAATRNRGLAAATGSFLLHLDADDLLLPNAIATLMQVFENHPSCTISAGRFSAFVSPEVPAHIASRFDVHAQPQRGHLSGVALIRSDVFNRIGPLDKKYEPAADMEWWQRAVEADVGIQFIDDLVQRRRIHGNNTSLLQRAALRQASLLIAREALRRRHSRNG